jgi:hypothetical protein
MGIVKGSSIWKWVSVVITILAPLTISLKITEILISYIIFLIGHLSMALIMLKDKDWSLFSMNIIWIVIDITGIITWS